MNNDNEVNNTLVLEDKIATLAKAEQVTKLVLGELSRDLLYHYTATGSVELINKLLGRVAGEDSPYILTPLNFRAACLYFREFIPHGSNWSDCKDYVENGTGKRIPLEFGKRSGNRARAIGDALLLWLAVEDNNIWLWTKAIKMTTPSHNYAKELTKAVENAVDSEKGDLSTDTIINCLLAGGVEASDILGMVEQLAAKCPNIEVEIAA